MKRSTGGGRWSRVVRAFFVASFLCTCVVRAQSDKDLRHGVREDQLVDRRDRDGDRRSHVSLAPFPSASVKTSGRETLGIRVLWVETAHFKLGRRLTEAATSARKRASRRDQFTAACDKFQMPGEVDPWLRLHLYALRPEDVHADFVRSLAITKQLRPGRRRGRASARAKARS